jgi:RNA polymerase sigma factor (sigma-70 family)
MSTEKEEWAASAADDAALRPEGNQLDNSSNGDGHPAERDSGAAGRMPLPGPPASEAAQAVQERALRCRGVAERLAWRQYRRCERSVPVEDLLGTAHLALVEAAWRYDPDRGVPLEAYVIRIVGQRLMKEVKDWHDWHRLHPLCFVDLARPGSRGPSVPLVDPPCPRTPEPDSALAAREALERVRRELPEQWFTALWMHYVEEQTFEEIGRQMEVSRQWVGQLINKAKERVQRLCPEEGDLC